MWFVLSPSSGLLKPVCFTSVLKITPSFMPFAASIQKTNVFLEKSVEVRHALIWRIILVICTGGFLGV